MVEQVRPSFTVSGSLYKELRDAILGFEIVPSMRAVMTAGKALARDNTCGYNCSYLPVDHPRSFDEAFFILLCGTGVGFSVERQYISRLPKVPDSLDQRGDLIVVRDSKEGWATGLRELVAYLYSGSIPGWDVSQVRPAGARLKTFGGRASGPGPLVELFNFVVNTFLNARGRRLNSIECHDVMCKIGQIVVVGGVRRSAMISLSNLSDDRMRTAKSGAFWETDPQRSLANNSVAYTERPEVGAFMKEWLSLYDSHSGERGIFNRVASQAKAAENGRRNSEVDFGTNPCSEIILRPYQFCNLTEVVVRDTDTPESLERKVRLAAILGTFQSTLTYFPYLRKVWKRNTEEERLLGVSLTGIMDNQYLNHNHPDLPSILSSLRSVAVDTNKEFAELLGIPQSAAVTCVKPSGTVSQLVDSASGIHSRYAPFYIRRVRIDNKDPIKAFMVGQGVPSEPDKMSPDNITVFAFPKRTPVGGVSRHARRAVDELEHWLLFQRYWCEHKPSVTINVRENEWPEVGAWVWNHFDEVSGISFLPNDNHVYQQAPYEEITKEQYDELVKQIPTDIDWDFLRFYEDYDQTAGTQTFACSADSCEVVDLVK